jgi:amino acid adenylation domain-containing protein
MAYLLQHLLIESAVRFPNNQAVRFEGDSLTYSELDRQSNQVARALRSLGVKRGDRVGIYVNKSLGSVISIFGVLKASGVYVPLDPNAPIQRLAYIARNCDIQIILTSSKKLLTLPDLLSEGTPIKGAVITDNNDDPAVSMPENVKVIGWNEVVNLDESPVSDQGTIETDLAYILYTSGSTGDPKGVMISHRTIFTFINWCYEKFQVNARDRVTSHAPIHFDLSTFDIFVTCKAGGTIVLIPEKLSIFPLKLVQLLQDEQITITYMVPSILSMMVNYGKLDQHDLSSLRSILFAGEVFQIKYLRQLMAAIPQADYFNLYGPTETNVCTYYKVQPKDIEPDCTQPVPIGIACENIEVFAADESGKLVTQTGVEGELWVRGSCVAAGYWGDPEKTAKRFVHNHFQTHFDEVAYRTGDMVTLDEDGINWIFIGRRDHMIKSRGYRIELGEIEAALYGHTGVKEAAVIALPDELVGNRIKAFVVPLKMNGLSVKELQSYCSQKLPRYMVPEIIEFMDGLPKTSTGKVNRPELARELLVDLNN